MLIIIKRHRTYAIIEKKNTRKISVYTTTLVYSSGALPPMGSFFPFTPHNFQFSIRSRHIQFVSAIRHYRIGASLHHTKQTRTRRKNFTLNLNEFLISLSHSSTYLITQNCWKCTHSVYTKTGEKNSVIENALEIHSARTVAAPKYRRKKS